MRKNEKPTEELKPVEPQALIPIESVNAATLFSGEHVLRTLLASINDSVKGLVFDVSTEEGRKECKAVAYNIARSKTAIDDAGKDLVSGWKEQAKVVDNLRKEAREFLTDLQAKVRRPVTEWEEEQERIAQAEADAAAAIAAEQEAYEMDKAWENERKLREAQAEVVRQQAELAKLQREAREREIREEAEKAAQARADAAAKDRIEAAERRAEMARDEERRRQEAQQREASLAREREAKEIERKRELQEEEDRRRREDLQHRQTVNKAALEILVKLGVDMPSAKQVIGLVATGQVPQMKMDY